jgi:hypothetical protein
MKEMVRTVIIELLLLCGVVFGQNTKPEQVHLTLTGNFSLDFHWKPHEWLF